MFLLGEIAEIGDHGGHTTDKDLVASDATDFVDGRECFIGRCGIIEKNGHNGRVVGIKGVINSVREDFCGEIGVGETGVPDDGLDVVNLLDGGFELSNIICGHIFGDDK